MKQSKKQLKKQVEALTKENAELKFRSGWANRGNSGSLGSKKLEFEIKLNTEPLRKEIDRISRGIKEYNDLHAFPSFFPICKGELEALAKAEAEAAERIKIKRWLYDPVHVNSPGYFTSLYGEIPSLGRFRDLYITGVGMPEQSGLRMLDIIAKDLNYAWMNESVPLKSKMTLSVFNKNYKGYFIQGKSYSAPDIVLLGGVLYQADFIYYGNNPLVEIKRPGVSALGWRMIKDPRK